MTNDEPFDQSRFAPLSKLSQLTTGFCPWTHQTSQEIRHIHIKGMRVLRGGDE